MRRLLPLLAAAVASGCATPKTAIVDGRVVPRLAAGYTDGDLFFLEHRGIDPRTDAPSTGLWGYGGDITGRACGLDLALYVEHLGRKLFISGFALPVGSTIPPIPVQIQVRDRDGAREIWGYLQTYTGASIDLRLTSDRLSGRVALRQLDLHADGDAYVGAMLTSGERVPFAALGRRSVWEMPAADQAVLLATMLSCDVHSSLAVRDGPRVVGVDDGGAYVVSLVHR